jgi:hypothetical protein
MIEYLLAALALGYGFIVVRDFHKFIKRSYEAIDRDQKMLDKVVEIPITHIHPELAEDDDVIVHGEFDIDLDDDESTAVLKFIDQFRAAKEQHDRDS